LQQALAKADYHPEDGWVLLDFDFGLAEVSQTSNTSTLKL